ncbi:hypothetical protein Tco_0275311, partial [Tanacetum coccineum]
GPEALDLGLLLFLESAPEALGPCDLVRLKPQSETSLSLALQPKEVETRSPFDCLQQSYVPAFLYQ